MKHMILIISTITLLISNLYGWGHGSHRIINAAAVDHLPTEMSFFQDHREYLRVHSVDPDYSSDPYPDGYHWIDIDYYDAFFTGTLPHEWQAIIDMYGQATVEDVGIVPWVITWWMDDMAALMEAGDWNQVWQKAAELGHYIADSHQALHLTVNYNGWDTGNGGVHSRYETEMMNDHLDEIVLSDSIAEYWETPLESIFSYIDDIYPIVDLVMAADDLASDVDSNHGNTYLNIMWEEVGDTTIWSLERAVLDLASVWYTAWVNAGSPYPPGVVNIADQRPSQFELTTFPNPFNGQVNLSYQIMAEGETSLRIFDLNGRLVRTLVLGSSAPGDYVALWDGKDQDLVNVSSGIYLCELQNTGSSVVQKVSLLK